MFLIQSFPPSRLAIVYGGRALPMLHAHQISDVPIRSKGIQGLTFRAALQKELPESCQCSIPDFLSGFTS